MNPQSFRPPFRSTMPNVVERAAAETPPDAGDAWRKVIFSATPNARGAGVGMYGDFGRYVMQSAVNNFLEDESAGSGHGGLDEAYVGAMLAYRYSLQRIKELGWTSERFAWYEDQLPYLGRAVGDDQKVERVSKKCQWIALHEFLGYLSDHRRLDSWWGDRPGTYRGAWDLLVRDFDPSGATHVDQENDVDHVGASTAHAPEGVVLERYPDPLDNQELVTRREDWVVALPADPISLLRLRVPAVSGTEDWLVLRGFWRWSESKLSRLEHGAPGRCEAWVHVRSWLVDTGDTEEFLSCLRGMHFYGNGLMGVEFHGGWLGEYPAGGPFQPVKEACASGDQWFWHKELDILHIQTTCEQGERGGAVVPSPQLHDRLDLRWSGGGSTFLDRSGQATAMQVKLPGAGETLPCVVRREALLKALNEQGLTLVWAALGSRECSDSRKAEFVGGVRSEHSALFQLCENQVVGGVTHHRFARSDAEASAVA